MDKHLNCSYTMRLAVIVLILLAACTPEDNGLDLPPTEIQFTLPSTWTPDVASDTTAPPAITRAPTWTPIPTPTLQASLTPLPTIDTSATPILGYCLQAETACEIKTSPSARRGWCKLSSAETSCGLIYNYSLLYPQAWLVDTVGALHPNLFFNTGSEANQIRLFQLPAGGLTLDSADQALLCNETGDCLPVVSPAESVIRRRLRAYAKGDYLILTSSLGDIFITRYFVFLEHQEETRLYTIEIRVPAILADSEEYNLLLDQTEVLLNSLQPDTRIEVTPYVFPKTPTPETSVTPSETPSETPPEASPTP